METEKEWDISQKEEKKQEFEQVLLEGTKEELNDLKAWLFKENIRLEMERTELKRMEERLIKERQQFQSEMTEVNRRLVIEKQRLKQDEAFFDKKMDILKSGFAQLEADRRKLEKERITLEARQNAYESNKKYESNFDKAELLFQGVKSQLALKKRYRDLIKMFHPDNVAGDHEMVLIINSVYEELKKDYEMERQA